GTLPPKFYVSSLSLLKSTLFVSGYMKKEQALVALNCITGKSSIMALPGAGLRMSIQQMEPSEKEGILAVSILYGKKKLEKTFQVCFIGEDGKKVKEPLKLDKDPSKYILSASITWLSASNYIISGSYSVDKNYRSNGIYIAEFDNDQLKFIKYHNFADLKNFLDFLNKRQKEKLEKKVARKKSQGKEDLLDAFVITHPVFEHSGEFVLIGEIFFPTYRTETRVTYASGKAQTTYVTVFDGYQYSHATIIGMDMEGNKKWDHCFDMWLIYKPYSVIRNIREVHTGNDIRLFFSTGRILQSCVISTGKLTEKELGKIETEKEGDNVKWTGFTQSYYWYENYFICYGTQMIKNTEDKKVDRKRTVFFVSKIKVD
ncbi:MAG TPA: hypothetical protein VI731_08715, partial [Bacteroidia bacterium]|nr:hypothetical protein [Bacteroidia bacterium]